MGRLYVAKAPALVVPTKPPGWPVGWAYPGPPWPPGTWSTKRQLYGRADGVCTAAGLLSRKAKLAGASAGVATAAGVLSTIYPDGNVTHFLKTQNVFYPPTTIAVATYAILVGQEFGGGQYIQYRTHMGFDIPAGGWSNCKLIIQLTSKTVTGGDFTIEAHRITPALPWTDKSQNDWPYTDLATIGSIATTDYTGSAGTPYVWTITGFSVPSTTRVYFMLISSKDIGNIAPTGVEKANGSVAAGQKPVLYLA